jgi:hypothetical protein
MTFLVRPGAPLYTTHVHSGALAGWRKAARLVSSRWDCVLIADRDGRADAFVAYVAALDAEAAAADQLSLLQLGEAL